MFHIIIFSVLIECFEQNSLEQLTINYANECIQQFCVKNLMRDYKSSSHDAVIGKLTQYNTFSLDLN